MPNLPRKPIDTQATLLMAFMCLVMALGQIVLKYTAMDMAATLQIAVRSGGAAIIIFFLVWLRNQPVFTVPGGWLPGLLLGLLFSGEFLLIGEALRYTTASHLSIFLYTAPIFAALGLHILLPDERLRPRQWLGVILAFFGIALTFLGRDPSSNTPSSPNMLLGDLLAISAGFFWGAATVLIRATRLKEALATETLMYQLIAAFFILGALAFLTDQTTVHYTWRLAGSLFFQTVILSVVGLLIWFWLLRKYLASRLGVLSFMTPFFGVVLGVLLLDEPLDKGFIWGSLCLIVGILLVNSKE